MSSVSNVNLMPDQVQKLHQFKVLSLSNNQSYVKGFLWAYVGMVSGGVALTAAGFTLKSGFVSMAASLSGASLLSSGAAVAAAAGTIATAVLGSISLNSFSNAGYHLFSSQHQVIVIQ